MAISYPLTIPSFFGKLRILSCDFELSQSIETSKTAGGEVLQADIGPRLWSGPVVLAAEKHTTAETIKAQLHLLRGAGRSFFAHAFPLCAPKLDPKGLVLGGAVPQINSLNTNNKEMSLKGLPVGYTLSIGDYLSFAYGASPVRYAYHQIQEIAVADGTGVTPQFTVAPNIRLGAAVNTTVVLVKPFFKAIMTDSSIGSMVGNRRDGMSFTAQQTLR